MPACLIKYEMSGVFPMILRAFRPLDAVIEVVIYLKASSLSVWRPYVSS
jgi:hypothetical protein